ncbi:hypothetical protein N7491_007481 [Penicillium cf. griseofulvum]|uniref:Uncharacterized protein n=1 Tax=Penicillium cf. griseofulvum TaxID=2972120 RepID=A0A9W9IXK1_9EURO|nr:hypothetical protein N7472_009490 [Penicillium cf. griseofulvum]KAJ5430465.1 hypothetical protein N7491_007481 [Penicillium cf. griseofulvum]KAJ5435764.1 hypothetical protein N7445_006649 [Penicillium cf. griseofulvum]
MASENQPVSPPPGWTIDPEELDYEGEWAAVDSWGYRLATSYELGKCTPIMCDPQGGGLIFEASGKFYRVDQMSGDVVQIILPETLGEIVAVMKGESRRKTLKTRLLGSTA